MTKTSRISDAPTPDGPCLSAFEMAFDLAFEHARLLTFEGGLKPVVLLLEIDAARARLLGFIRLSEVPDCSDLHAAMLNMARGLHGVDIAAYVREDRDDDLNVSVTFRLLSEAHELTVLNPRVNGVLCRSALDLRRLRERRRFSHRIDDGDRLAESRNAG